MNKLDRIYDRWIAGLAYLRCPVLLAIRLYWGYQFFITGKGKLMNIDRTAGFFRDLHIPFPKLNVIMAGSTECIGGLLLLLGLGSRIITVPLIFTMIVAYGTAHRDVLKEIVSNPDGVVSAPPFLFLLTCVIVLIFGPGKISVDYLIARARGRVQPPRMLA